MAPTQIKYFRVNRASTEDTLWLVRTLEREGKSFGTRVELCEDNTLTLVWE
jgi:poly-gamma-glutamate synthesis protein (capsule biosynthesis protein)